MSDFQKLISARFLYTLSVQMQAVVVGWQVYDLTRDPLALGLVGLTEAVPALGLALYAGYVVDRNGPVKIYRGVLSCSLLAAVILAASAVFGTSFSIAVHLAALYVASFFTGTARAFSQPAMFSMVIKLVDRTGLPRAQAWMSTIMQTGRVVGPALGGVVFGFHGVTVAYLTIVGLLLGAQVLAALIRTEIPPPENPSVAPLKDELLKGLRFVFRSPLLLPAMTLDMVSVLFGGVTALLPIFAIEILNVGPRGLGALRAAPALGAVAVGIYLAQVPVSKRAGTQLFTSVAGFGFCILIFAASKNFYLSLIALAVSGAFDGVSTVIRSTLVQLASPDHMRGRITAVSSIFIGSSNEVGEFESGVAARLMGAVPAAYFGGVVCLLTVAILGWRSPALRKLDLTRV